ncbi:uncharacterized protein LOC121726898 [Aricia agestis]|uniref:uncharacterized protein LOC121726898 n=1 Tax=Aricia agestis TaxID=91739 RepID=UPI001C20AE20|nr:uncharacterized protein LOC121726898 [Aricia agestis]
MNCDSNERRSSRSIYYVNFFEEAKRRWMVLGVLTTVALAVLAPQVGAPGGLLHAEYLSYLPLTYIYYKAGKSRTSKSRVRLYTLTVLHANVGALVVCVVTVSAMSTTLDRRVIEGAILASTGRPCAWLPVSLLSCNTVPTLAAVNYAVSLLLSPLTHYFLCGQIPIPPLGGVVFTSVATLAPFALGHYTSKPESESWSRKACGLAVLYAECCALLRDAEGSLYVTDVIATLLLAVWCVVGTAASGALYARGGLLSAAEARALLLVATPKATHIGWSDVCFPAGMSRLPAVFMAPAQALLLAAVFTTERTDQTNKSDQRILPR